MKLNLLTNVNEQTTSMVNDLTQIINQLFDKQDSVVIAVSGGKSPISLFKKLCQAKLNWQKITFTLVDERVVNQSSIDSNEHLTRNHLLCGNAAHAKFVGLMHSDGNINNMVADANRLVKKIDIAILGMGEDGHTASIFPDCKEVTHALDVAQEPSYIITNPISAKYQRIGLNLSALIHIPHLLLSINSETKLKILQESIREQSLNYPISYLAKQRPDMTAYWFE
jgi:6-phosphogluconolactonase